MNDEGLLTPEIPEDIQAWLDAAAEHYKTLARDHAEALQCSDETDGEADPHLPAVVPVDAVQTISTRDKAIAVEAISGEDPLSEKVKKAPVTSGNSVRSAVRTLASLRPCSLD